MEGLPHSVIGYLTKICEGRFHSDRAEGDPRVQGLQQLGRPHGFSETENALWMLFRIQEIEALMNIVPLEQSICREFASAHAVSPGVRHEDGESVRNQQLRISSHADAVVAKPVKQNDGISVAVQWTNSPRAKYDTVRRCGGHLLKIGVQCASVMSHGGKFVFGQWPPRGMQRPVGEINTADGAKIGIQE